MKRLSLALAATAVVAMMVPVGAQAAEDPVRIDCFGFAPTNGAEPQEHMSKECAAEATDLETGEAVSVPAGMHASILNTHANFHSSRTYGEVELTWKDGTGAVVQAWTCIAASSSDDYFPSSDLVNAHCREKTPFNPNYAPGTGHTVNVNVLSANGCPAAGPSSVRPHGGCYFHGRLYLTDSSVPV